MVQRTPDELTDVEVQAFFDRANYLDGREATCALYRDWAELYDGTLGRFGRYLSPDRIAEEVARLCSDRRVTVLDVACGTGLVGVALAQRGFKNLTGLDLSPEMLAEARRKGCYSTLVEADLGGAVDLCRFGVVVAAGVLTMGHLGVAAFEQMVGLLDSGGVIVTEVEGGTYSAQGFAAVLEAMQRNGSLESYVVQDGHFYAASSDEPPHGVYVTARAAARS